MLGKENHIHSAYEELQSERDELQKRLKIVDDALNGLAPLVDDAGNGDIVKLIAKPIHTVRRVAKIDPRPIPKNVEQAVREYVKRAEGDFSLREMRKSLRAAPHGLNEDEAVFYVALVMRRLEHEGLISVMTRPWGRRDGIYRKAEGR